MDKNVIPYLRFNRYIVECKCVEMDKNVIPYLRFNRYIVECKSPSTVTMLFFINDLIDT